MLRTLILVLAVAAPGVASAQQQNERQFPDSAVGIEVRGDDGTVIGRVDHVERDRRGRIVAAEIAGLEPGNAPYAPSNLVAGSDGEPLVISDRRDDRRISSEQTRTR